VLPAPHSKKYYETACPEGGLGFQVCSGRLPFLNRFPFEESANVSVVIRMKRMGRKNRAFYRICATDKRSPRDGRVIEEIGTYDPLIPDTDARCTLNGERLQHWLSVGALPSDAVRVLIKKYGPAGTHLAAMEQARVKLSMPRIIPPAQAPVFVPVVKSEPTAPEAAVSEVTAIAEETGTVAVAGAGETIVETGAEAAVLASTEIPASEESAGS